MTRSELNRMKEALAKGMLLDGILVDERPTESDDSYVLSPIVISPTHIGWEFVETQAVKE